MVARIAIALSLLLAWLQWCEVALAQSSETLPSYTPETPGSNKGEITVAIQWEIPAHSRARTQSAATISTGILDEELARWNVGGSSDSSHVSNRKNYHPGTRVIVDFDPSPATKLIVPLYLPDFRNRGYWAYRLCFETSLDQPPRKTIDAHLRVTIGHKGRVTSARIVQTNVREKLLNDCLLRATRSIAVRPASSRRVTIPLRVRISPGDAPLGAYGNIIDGREMEFSAAANAASVKQEVESCVRAAFYRDKRLWGRLEFKISVDGHGHPTAVAENGTHFPDTVAVECSVKAFFGTSFPALSHPAISRIALRLGLLPSSARPQNELLWVDSDSNRGPTD